MTVAKPVNALIKNATAVLLGLSVTHQQTRAQETASVESTVASQFAITLPQGWSIYDQSAAVLHRTDGTGILIFSAVPVTKPGETGADADLLSKIDTGESRSFFVERQHAVKNATCSNLPKPAVYGVATTIAQDPLIRRAFYTPPPRSTDIELGGCHGVRFLVDAKKDDPENHWIIDVRMVSDGKFQYLFTLRNKANYYEQSLPTFDSALASIRFTSLTQ